MVDLSGVHWLGGQAVAPSASPAHETEAQDGRVSVRELLDLLERRSREASGPALPLCECCCDPRFALSAGSAHRDLGSRV